MYRRHVTLGLATAILGGAFAARLAHAQTSQDRPDQTLIDLLTSDPQFGTTVQMFYVSGAASRMNTGRRLTLFAATNTAWDNSPFEGLLASLSSNGAGSEFPRSMDILGILRGFVVRSDVEPGALTGKQVALTSAAGRQIVVDGAAMKVNWVAPDGEQRSAPIAGKPILASNGAIYPMDVVVGQ